MPIHYAIFFNHYANLTNGYVILLKYNINLPKVILLSYAILSTHHINL